MLYYEDAEWSEYIHVVLSGEDVVGVRIALFVVLACVRNHYVRTLQVNQLYMLDEMALQAF